MGLFLCYLAISLAHPSHVMSGVSLTQWSFSWLQTALSKNGIMYVEDQALSQEPSAGNAVMVHRRVGGAMNYEPASPNYSGSLGVSSFLWRLMASIFASLLVPFISPPLSVPSSFFCFSMQVAQNGALPPQWPPQPQSEISKHLTNILESPFHQPWLGRYRGM